MVEVRDGKYLSHSERVTVNSRRKKEGNTGRRDQESGT